MQANTHLQQVLMWCAKGRGRGEGWEKGRQGVLCHPEA